MGRTAFSVHGPPGTFHEQRHLGLERRDGIGRLQSCARRVPAAEAARRTMTAMRGTGMEAEIITAG